MWRFFRFPFLMFALLAVAGCGADGDKSSQWLTIDNETGAAVLERRLFVGSSAVFIAQTDALIVDGEYRATSILFGLPDDLAPIDWLELIRDETFIYWGVFMPMGESPFVYELSSRIYGDYRRLEYIEAQKLYRLRYTTDSKFKDVFL